MITEYDLCKAQRDIQRAYNWRNDLVYKASREGWEDREIAAALGLTRMAVWKIRQRPTTKGKT